MKNFGTYRKIGIFPFPMHIFTQFFGQWCNLMSESREVVKFPIHLILKLKQ